MECLGDMGMVQAFLRKRTSRFTLLMRSLRTVLPDVFVFLVFCVFANVLDHLGYGVTNANRGVN